MDRAMRLHVVAKIMYDVGWVALVGGTLVHLNIANRVFSVVDLSKRSLGRRTLLVHRALFSQTSGMFNGTGRPTRALQSGLGLHLLIPLVMPSRMHPAN
jgi:hypothetical protein